MDRWVLFMKDEPGKRWKSLVDLEELLEQDIQ